MHPLPLVVPTHYLDGFSSKVMFPMTGSKGAEAGTCVAISLQLKPPKEGRRAAESSIETMHTLFQMDEAIGIPRWLLQRCHFPFLRMHSAMKLAQTQTFI